MVSNPNAASGYSPGRDGGGSASVGRSLQSHVQDAASVVGSRIQDLVREPGARAAQLRDGWDSLVRVVFAPCAGDVGGVPREDLGDDRPAEGAPGARDGGPSSPGGGRGAAMPSWGASVPFEVSASQDRAGSSLVMKDSSFASSQHTRDLNESYLASSRGREARGEPQATIPEQRALTPGEQRRAESQARLRRLGARHQLASGLHGESLADAAQPIAPGQDDDELTALMRAEAGASADFDDGISAISSHTLEEMERRRQNKDKKKAAGAKARARENVLRLHPQDFSQIVDEDAERNDRRRGHGAPAVVPEEGSDEKNTEVVFGEPFYRRDDDPAAAALRENVRTVVDESNGVAHDEFVPQPVSGRVASNRTQRTLNTTVTEDSHEFEEMYRRHEAMYWVDEQGVAESERSARESRRSTSMAASPSVRPTSRGMSIEERARRLRELSRSRSRSDGTGSSNKSGSSLVSGQHPHDTVPVYSSDLFSRRKRSGGGGRSRRSRSGNGGALAPEGLTPGSDPFESLDYGEI